jgi:hypothetical protein
MILIIVVAVVAAVMVVSFGRTVRIVPQARAYVVERLGSYSQTLDAGLNSVVPFIDRIRARVDLREQVVCLGRSLGRSGRGAADAAGGYPRGSAADGAAGPRSIRGERAPGTQHLKRDDARRTGK